MEGVVDVIRWTDPGSVTDKGDGPFEVEEGRRGGGPTYRTSGTSLKWGHSDLDWNWRWDYR